MSQPSPELPAPLPETPEQWPAPTTQFPQYEVTWAAPNPTAAPIPDVPLTPAQRRRRKQTVLALAAAVVLLLAGGGVLTALLIKAHNTASAVATAEASADRQHQQDLQDVEDQRGPLDQRISAAQSDIQGAEARMKTADAARQSAEAAAAADQQADAEAQAHDEAVFLDSMRDVMPGVADDDLVARGRAVCSSLDSGVDLSDAFDRAASKYGFDKGTLLVTAAVVMFCPEYN
jgi:hypothetical protein